MPQFAVGDTEFISERPGLAPTPVPLMPPPSVREAITGESGALKRALEQVERVAATDSTVLLLGETGTGKELFASRIHELSARRNRPMVCVNCAAIPATLIESELFGREKGAYTGACDRQIGRFELADRSSIFLDEIGELPLDLQVKLLRVLEERHIERLGSVKSITIDTRIIVATNRSLEQRVADGRFRADLFYRLNVFPIRVPSLRERTEDIPLLVWRFIEEFSPRFGKQSSRSAPRPWRRCSGIRGREHPRAAQRRRARDDSRHRASSVDPDPRAVDRRPRVPRSPDRCAAGPHPQDSGGGELAGAGHGRGSGPARPAADDPRNPHGEARARTAETDVNVPLGPPVAVIFWRSSCRRTRSRSRKVLKKGREGSGAGAIRAHPNGSLPDADGRRELEL